MDDFMFFCLAAEDQAFLKQYRSPRGESSWFKDIPIEQLDYVVSLMSKLNTRSRIVYRGPRKRHYAQASTWKQDANRFAVYERY